MIEVRVFDTIHLITPQEADSITITDLLFKQGVQNYARELRSTDLQADKPTHSPEYYITQAQEALTDIDMVIMWAKESV